MSTWALGAVNPKKVIHRPGCVHAKRPYPYFDGKDADDVLADLIWNCSLAWHTACNSCAPELRSGIIEAQRIESHP